MTTREFHPVASIFPLMDGARYTELVEDIKQNGLREPITVHRDGRVIDGRNRYRACTQLGIEPPVKTWQRSDDELLGYVLSLNLHRRHLDESQRAMVAARVAILPLGANQHREGGSIDLPSQPQAAELLNVSVPSVKRARVVLDSGVPELVQAVDKGELSVSFASRVARLPPDVQGTIVVGTNGFHSGLDAYRHLAFQSDTDAAASVPAKCKYSDQMTEIIYARVTPAQLSSLTVISCAMSLTTSDVVRFAIDELIEDIPEPRLFTQKYRIRYLSSDSR